MKIVIDSNRVVASLLKESTTRKILYTKYFDFIAPEFVKEEIEKYEKEFIKKANISSEDFNILLSLLFERITLIPKEVYDKYLENLETKISDVKDIPYLACCIAVKADGIWSHDPHFLEQNKVKIFTNKDMLKMV